MKTQDEISVKELYTLKQSKQDFILLDVREPFEYETCNLGGRLIPLKTLPEHLSSLDKDKHVIVHCKLGGRSLQAVNFLKANGFTHVSNLTGGIIAWINEIDPEMKKY
jgi:sulfur-carrier protein adenylyltransferase/sulfurtransferase